MTTLDEFLDFVSRELGLDVTTHDADRNVDELPGWDSMFLLTLVTALEQQAGRRVLLADALQASTLRDVHKLAVDA
ncbi:acyl carrier protein [Streptomyces diacarni]|uniref:Acyl carrier protein n=1 Tax=Streptomyces diacarni TaxID=2800381 RepID=A0A367EEM5_9ACTN|nr:acyl carrier protein [Streptomyces diacarni]RCG16192.1 acyl carrier protein [Streptomyces diacarni]